MEQVPTRWQWFGRFGLFRDICPMVALWRSRQSPYRVFGAALPWYLATGEAWDVLGCPGTKIKDVIDRLETKNHTANVSNAMHPCVNLIVSCYHFHSLFVLSLVVSSFAGSEGMNTIFASVFLRVVHWERHLAEVAALCYNCPSLYLKKNVKRLFRNSSCFGTRRHVKLLWMHRSSECSKSREMNCTWTNMVSARHFDECFNGGGKGRKCGTWQGSFCHMFETYCCNSFACVTVTSHLKVLPLFCTWLWSLQDLPLDSPL